LIFIDECLIRCSSKDFAMTQTDAATLLAFFKAMANESRLRIVGLLAQHERTVQELAETLSLSEPTVSHHLGVLKAISLVSVRPDGVMRWHALRPGALTEMNRRLLEQDAADLAPKATWEDQVLATFLDPDQRLKTIPASRRKRWVILKWLAERFSEDRPYPEASVNEMLQRHHWDSATLRRELIGARMMAREAGIYRRLPQAQWRDFADARPEPA
jgi:DNA-binding transcriptional ArsR family regulator